MKKTWMSFEEFKKRDLELKDRIAAYRLDSCNHKVQIELNEIEITKLEQERVHLRAEFGFAIGKQEEDKQ